MDSYTRIYESEDPLCAYKEDGRDILFGRRGYHGVPYCCVVAKLVHLYIPNADLVLISLHSLRVTTCVLRNETGKDGPYIKLRIRFLSNCFEVYLCNTDRITQHHTEALADDHANLAALLTQMIKLDTVTCAEGIHDNQTTDVEDED